MLRGLSDIFESWQSRLRTIIDILETSEVNEIEVSFFGRKIRVSKGSVVNSIQSPVQVENITEPQTVSENINTNQTSETQVTPGIEIKAPMVGTFYRSPSPESPSFVNEGDHVSVGQVICIIEAMKIMNEIESEKSGVIKEVIVENGSPVEFNQPLFIIEAS